VLTPKYKKCTSLRHNLALDACAVGASFNEELAKLFVTGHLQLTVVEESSLNCASKMYILVFILSFPPPGKGCGGANLRLERV
jgi:hypothetical protein